ncbi:MAG TPA: hypothetical protein VKE40_14520 [Gemmataceae bacterium]|nr:hypothetical protein [Gemmataceae bacterium]
MAHQPELAIALRGERRDDALRVSYTFTNQGRYPVYVFTRVASGLREPLSHRAYTAFREDETALHLFLGIPPIPKGMHVYAKVVPFSSLLRPGETYTDYIEVPVPAVEWQPYADPEAADDTDPVEARRVLLSTEYWWENRSIRAAPLDGHPGYFKAIGAPGFAATATLGLPEPIPVKKRRDAFERF